MKKPVIIAICGPTASGKTKLSIELAKNMGGEIVSCDSMQIYKYMNIGTAKPTEKEKCDIKHHMIDIVNPDERFSVMEYQKGAMDAIKDILSRNKVPIIVGGTGLYLDSIVNNLRLPKIDFDEEYRKYLEKRAEEEGLDVLYREAYKIDPEATEKISINDKKRIIRILEIYHETGINKTVQNILSKSKESEYDFLIFGLQMNREILYGRINRRVDEMVENGLIEEVEMVKGMYKDFPTAMQAIGYKEVVEYLKKEITKEEMIEKIKQDTRHYAKRQMTWFNKNKNIIWLDALDDMQNNIKVILEEYCERHKK